jgi:tripartite-type tricarboxylate transporter receptor subunit TctC
MIAQNFIGLFAPARTPPAIIAQVAQATRAVMDDEAFLRSLTASGFEPSLRPRRTRPGASSPTRSRAGAR